MGIKDFFKRQLRTVIEWKEQKTNLLFHQLETTTDEIKNASNLSLLRDKVVLSFMMER